MELSFSQELRFHLFSQSPLLFISRDEATRTPDPYVPNVVRYQLRYIPISRFFSAITALDGVSRRSFTGVNSHPRDLPALFSPKINFEILFVFFGDNGVGRRFSSVIYRSKLPSSRLALFLETCRLAFAEINFKKLCFYEKEAVGRQLLFQLLETFMVVQTYESLLMYTAIPLLRFAALFLWITPIFASLSIIE